MGKSTLAKRRLSKNVHKSKILKNERILAYLFVLIPIFGYLFFNVFPLIISFIIQFGSMDYYLLDTFAWNNFENFVFVYTNPDFYLSIGVTLMLSTSQLISLLIALFMSVLLSKKPFGHKVFQVIYFIPYICSSVATALMWGRMFNPDYGIVNDILVKLFGEGAKVDWLQNAAAYPWLIIIATIWQAPGYGIVMYKAALNQVNPSLYEAADIDGASSFKKFWRITLPSIAPTTFFLLMAGIINGLQIFDLAKLFGSSSWTGEAGPGNIGLSTAFLIYKYGTEYYNMPVASVMSWALFIVIFVISVINFNLRKKWVDE